MAVNLYEKHIGIKEVSKKNKADRFQLDFYHGSKNLF